MIRAALYVGVSALVWLAEGFMFSRFLAFSVWQTVLLGVVYLVLLALCLYAVRNAWLRQSGLPGGIASWRVLSLAPMATTILGSFISLSIVVFVLALGKLG